LPFDLRYELSNDGQRTTCLEAEVLRLASIKLGWLFECVVVTLAHDVDWRARVDEVIEFGATYFDVDVFCDRADVAYSMEDIVVEVGFCFLVAQEFIIFARADFARSFVMRWLSVKMLDFAQIPLLSWWPCDRLTSR